MTGVVRHARKHEQDTTGARDSMRLTGRQVIRAEKKGGKKENRANTTSIYSSPGNHAILGTSIFRPPDLRFFSVSRRQPASLHSNTQHPPVLLRQPGTLALPKLHSYLPRFPFPRAALPHSEHSPLRHSLTRTTGASCLESTARGLLSALPGASDRSWCVRTKSRGDLLVAALHRDGKNAQDPDIIQEWLQNSRPFATSMKYRHNIYTTLMNRDSVLVDCCPRYRPYSYPWYQYKSRIGDRMRNHKRWRLCFTTNDNRLGCHPSGAVVYNNRH